MDQYDLYGGCSYPFAGFDNCSTYWKQASYAARNTERIKSNRITEYKDVQFKNMKEVISEDKSYYSLLDPSLVALAKSPKKTDRILIPCLKSYLLNGRSLSRTSAALGLHRNTLIYRIRRLEEILQLNFDMLTDDQMGAMILSCCLVDPDTE
nr:helix-turn-helix domain-containing protein [Clostridia bacterium]